MQVRHNGSLHAIIGPMFSGKSSLMIGSVERYSLARKKCIIIKHTIDQRFDEGAAIKTHAGFVHDMIPITYTSNLAQINANDPFDQYDIIGIDELQFFALREDEVCAVMDLIDEWILKGKVVICACLDTDWRREPFPILAKLIGRADYVTKLRAVCAICGEDAPFTSRTKCEGQLYDNPVGGSEKYTALCRQCYVCEASRR